MDSVAHPRTRGSKLSGSELVGSKLSGTELRGEIHYWKSTRHHHCGQLAGQLGRIGSPGPFNPHPVPPPMAANPPMTTGVELIIPPVAAVAAPSECRCFF